MTILLDGKKLAEKLTRKLAGQFKGVGKLAAIQVGDDAASVMYLKKKQALAEQVGVRFEWHKLPATAKQGQVTELIDKLNDDKKVAGIIVQLPLPKAMDVNAVVNAIDSGKDVDGLTDVNILEGKILPATAVGILKLLAEYKITTESKKIGLVGFTRLLNLPLAMYFAKRGNSVVVVQKGTKNFNELKQADVIITAVGKSNLISGQDIKTGAVVVDAGISRVGGKVVGDCDSSVAKKAAYLSPVPGGVGPMTVVSLLANLLQLVKK